MRPVGSSSLPRYDQVSDFAEGSAAVQWGGLWGHIRTTGDAAVPFQFEWAAPFSEGLAILVQKGDVHGFIDARGRIVIEPRFVTGGGFH